MQINTLLFALSVALGVTATTRISTRQDGAADFGDCDPTIDFQLGREGRAADEGTFLPVDPLVAEGQQGSCFLDRLGKRSADFGFCRCPQPKHYHSKSLNFKFLTCIVQSSENCADGVR